MIEKDEHFSFVQMDTQTRGYVKWAGNKEKIRRAISSKFSAASSCGWMAVTVEGRACYCHRIKQGNGVSVEGSCLSLFSPLHCLLPHGLSAGVCGRGRRRDTIPCSLALKFVYIKDLFSGPILLRTVDKLQIATF